MRTRIGIVAIVLCGLAASGATLYLDRHGRGSQASAQALPAHNVPVAKDGVVVELCDGKTSTVVKGLKPGQAMSRAQALAVTSQLMAQWRREHPDKKWEMAQADATGLAAANGQHEEKSSAKPGNGSASVSSTPGIQQGDTYASFHERDYKIWKAETDNFVEYGNKVFHSAKLLGGTIGVSCDMCHPNAANTHPETYPKYQEKLQRVALLRDMIDWCIENPVKGKTMDPNDPRLRALEAYILAQRKGVPLDYGKH
jgi:thiosulfate dehydrogenase